MNSPAKNTFLIKSKALELGFDACGISQAEPLEEDALHLKQWLEKRFNAEMSYMENYFEKRTNPVFLVEGAKSIITVLLNYKPAKKMNAAQSGYRISCYAYGEDYHFVIKDKLKRLEKFIQESIGPLNSRRFVDSGPVMERVWAARSGLGWIGKNSLLISKNLGSFVFIGEIIVDLPLIYDQPMADYCGSCTRCIDSCPTNAIIAPKVIDSRRCISYLTIEKKGALPIEFNGKYKDWIFGCDICQEVCPWNHTKNPTIETAFHPPDELLSLNKEDFENLSEERFQKIFRKSAVKRIKYKGLKRNIRFLTFE